MLVVSPTRYLTSRVNTLILSKDDLYFYVHRDVYDQIVVLKDRHTLESLTSLIGAKEVNEETVNWFYENAPSPINMLAPYLHLIEGEIQKDLVECCGVLHAICSSLNVRSFISQPRELRKSVIFSLSIKEEYEMAWDNFFQSSTVFGEQPVQQYVSSPEPRYYEEHSQSSGLTEIELEYGQGWEDAGNGVLYNSITGESMFLEDPDEDAAFLASLEESSEPETITAPDNNYVSKVTDAEKEERKALLEL